MIRVAMRMLVGDPAKFFGILLGVTLASMVITQQGSIFVGLMSRTFATIKDMAQPDIWVMDPKVQFIDDVKPLQSTALQRVRGVEGVDWAVPLYKGMIRVRLPSGQFVNCNLYGLDDASLIGAPADLLEGRVEDLRQDGAVIVDEAGAVGRLARRSADGTTRPLAMGDELELNDHRGRVVGVARVSRTFQSQPNLYTLYSRATRFVPGERKLMSFVLVRAKAGVDVDRVCAAIERETGLAAYTKPEFQSLTVTYFLKNTGIPINFGIAVALGFLVGAIITGFMFYSFTLDNLRYFGTLKAMGTSDGTLLGMILLQAGYVAVTGFGLGVGLAALFGNSMGKTQLAFRLTWQLSLVAACAVAMICALAALISVRRVISLEPGVVFK
ncbi:MAG: ABC transporter permease [Phycisphaerales bacterium]|nr:MAG: ABC transporter permease [Phycisphaerales bacterium]